MSSDDAYTSFLEKANADLQAGRQQEQQATMGIRTETVDVDEHIPAPLDRVGETFYVSDTDEPFEAVVLRWEGARKGVWPDYSQFSSLVSTSPHANLSVTTISSQSFDPRNHYAGILGAVREAISAGEPGSVEIKVYRVESSGARVEYWVLGLDGDNGRVVGVRAKAVES
ncbi:hypothetical protein MPDQ_000206 [Monascus purpureus]|uniref:Uncharacterized protein n=1 Tax=Monascus purpureus TaxID=5098 RepID=A0A507R5I0_MONPU|nr:hypothetical protein MPDQ_000206 [Monascus purpureus]